MPPKDNAYLNLQETMAAITRAASMMGVSAQEVGETLRKISVAMKPAITEVEKRITNVTAQKDEPKPLKQESTPPQPSLFEEFEIPHYEIETVDIEYSIDF